MSRYVVLGAGSTGTATARLLAEEGESVRLITRGGSGPVHPGIERVAADATDPDRLTALVEGAAALVNCAAPPYDRWKQEFPPLAASLLTAAGRTGAGYVMLGNVYAYGPVDGPVTESRPPAPTSVKGELRAAIWADALAAHRAGLVRATEVRAGSYFGPGAQSLFLLMAGRQLAAGEPAAYYADLDAPHSWAAPVDVARTLVAVARAGTGWGEVWHVPSFATLSARELAARLAAAAGGPAPRLTAMSDRELAELALEAPVLGEVAEMRYLTHRPFVLDSTRTERAFGVRATPVAEVVAAVAAELTGAAGGPRPA
ncbi:NAD-dependent epimerase/dehydratase family protein [Kitasatospora herbaricolor]|uniref:NAD-dependent epimerase/dehydratase family protein n=1 Tax=Kitasatospora herbaricolor TaxID=68217 RepID=UPI0036DEE1C4